MGGVGWEELGGRRGVEIQKFSKQHSLYFFFTTNKNWEKKLVYNYQHRLIAARLLIILHYKVVLNLILKTLNGSCFEWNLFSNKPQIQNQEVGFFTNW